MHDLVSGLNDASHVVVGVSLGVSPMKMHTFEVVAELKSVGHLAVYKEFNLVVYNPWWIVKHMDGLGLMVKSLDYQVADFRNWQGSFVLVSIVVHRFSAKDDVNNGVGGPWLQVQLISISLVFCVDAKI
jgi:hypothetical protein